MVAARNALRTSAVALLALLAALGSADRLGRLAWAVGVGAAVAVVAWVVRRLARSGTDRLGPADLVTLARVTIACGVAALVADASQGSVDVRVLVALAAVALALDAVDGPVARWTRTASPFGARFDGEADAFLILVLSVYVAGVLGPWVLLIGLARYLFAAAGWVWPWLRGELPVRFWAKTVAVVQGVVLTVAAADVLPRRVAYVLVAAALLLLVESFAWSVRWLWRHQASGPLASAAPDRHVGVPAR